MNDLLFVERTQAMLREHGVETWVFGGWGEELRGLILPRAHADVDLLYPSDSWDLVDELDYAWIPGKRFPWKRAFVLEGTVVEVFLVQRDARGWYTQLARRRHDWPENVLSSDGRLPVASTAALAGFRYGYRIDAAA